MPRNVSIIGPFNPRQNLEQPATIRSYSEQALIDFVCDRANRAFNSSSYIDMVNNFDRNERAYNGEFKNTNVPKWRSRAYVRTAFRLVEVEKAYMFDAMWDKAPYVMVSPISSKYRNSAPYMEAYINYIYHRMRYIKKFWDNLNYSVKHGVAITRRFWNFRINYRKKRLYVRGPDGMPVPTDRMTEMPFVEYDCPDFWVPDPRRVSWDPEGEYYSGLGSRYDVEEYLCDLDWLYTNRHQYGFINLDKLADQDYPAGATARTESVQKEAADKQISPDPMRKSVTITEYSGRLDLPGNQNDPRWYSVMVANNNVLIKPPKPIEGSPYDKYNMITKERTSRGISPISIILSDVDIINTLVNMRLDSMNLLINPRMLAWKGALADDQDLDTVAPGRTIQVKHGYDMGKVFQQLQMQDIGRIPFESQLAYHQRHIEENISLTPQFSGASGDTVRSATEINQTMERANSRFKAMVNAWRTTGYQDFIEATAKSIMYNMTETTEIPIFDQDWKPIRDYFLRISPFMVQGEFMFRFQDNLETNKDIQIQHWNNLLTTFNNIWDKLGDVRVQTVIREIIKANPMGKMLDVDKMFPLTLTPQEADLMNNENSRLEKAFDIGTPPGGGKPPEAPIGGGPYAGATAQQILNQTLSKQGG